jgi:protein TonB
MEAAQDQAPQPPPEAPPVEAAREPTETICARGCPAARNGASADGCRAGAGFIAAFAHRSDFFQAHRTAHHVGVAAGQAIDGKSRADYAVLVVAQIQAHRFYPEAARARSEEGAVAASFSIGASVRVSSAAIIRSSGLVDLDSAARQIVRSISPPPPPGGFFSASTTIRFHFE